ncbi:MAG: hypothetical protein HQL05_12385 [Nitrospirae bacterium]|uniref:hypothetical protein n=1 Tax=Candidatus Magnetobacterium casense TaxID=1455061 RepID=UPI00058E6310|nr:hypothetical protein [Candidatus Magnetobacterium casensis]MBF0338613.1 hypothetical protein [Nitrospirota bacterium]
MIEDLSSANRALQIENQRLRDENNILKGEQGKPDIKANTTSGKNKNKDASSEKERKGGDKEGNNSYPLHNFMATILLRILDSWSSQE